MTLRKKSIRILLLALVVAALGAEGVSRVSGLSHIRRGYQGLDDSLSALGADIRPRL